MEGTRDEMHGRVQLHIDLTCVRTNDLLVTISHRFIFADDICCTTQGKTFGMLEYTLTAVDITICRNGVIAYLISRAVMILNS